MLDKTGVKTTEERKGNDFVSKGEELSIKVVGHNLGALLAVLAANELHACLATDTERDITDHHRLPLPIAVVSFNDPNIDNRVFIDHLQNKRGVNMLCVVNAGDMAMCVPGESHVIVREGHVHVGTELRLDSRNSLCLHPDV
uniref:Fungal lipase-type domain-containing protein n=1 Tax=Oryza glumipatula TaxID=40148 RepID=A0A0E0A778_9ORYZ